MSDRAKRPGRQMQRRIVRPRDGRPGMVTGQMVPGSPRKWTGDPKPDDQAPKHDQGNQGIWPHPEAKSDTGPGR